MVEAKDVEEPLLKTKYDLSLDELEQIDAVDYLLEQGFGDASLRDGLERCRDRIFAVNGDRDGDE